MVKSPDVLEVELRKIAMDSGASDFKFIHPKDIITAHWVRLKCQFGCKNYGTRLSCPPYSPTPEETRKVLDEYQRAYIIKYQGFIGFDSYPPKDIADTMTKLTLHVCKASFEMERHAFLSGYYKAFSYGAHRCRKCDVCVVTEGGKTCKFPTDTRPSVESAGIDIFKTSKNAGIGTEVVVTRDISRKEELPTFTLLLVE